MLLGLKQPLYGASANGLKFGWLMIGLPVSYALFGILGLVLAVAFSDLSRYIPILIGQRRLNVSFIRQDVGATLALLGTMALMEWLRWLAHLGTSFDGLLEMMQS
jgi:hypothetical protein